MRLICAIAASIRGSSIHFAAASSDSPAFLQASANAASPSNNASSSVSSFASNVMSGLLPGVFPGVFPGVMMRLLYPWAENRFCARASGPKSGPPFASACGARSRKIRQRRDFSGSSAASCAHKVAFLRLNRTIARCRVCWWHPREGLIYCRVHSRPGGSSACAGRRVDGDSCADVVMGRRPQALGCDPWLPTRVESAGYTGLKESFFFTWSTRI
jgi:hypothetical protein